MFTVSEAAQILNISQTRVRQLAAQGALQGEKAGRSWLLEEASVMNRVAIKPKVGRPNAKSSSMDNEPNEKVLKELHGLYLEGKRLLGTKDPSFALLQKMEEEEASFLMAVSDFFLQQKQLELVSKGVF